MRASRLIVLGILIVSGYALAKADPIDPKVVVHAPSQPGGGGPAQSQIAGLTFSFTSPTGTSPGTSPCVIGGVNDPVCDILNVSGQDWTTLVIDISPGAQLNSCSVVAGFTNCVLNQAGTSTSPTIFTLSGGTGIPNGIAFGIGVDGWAPNTTFDFFANGSGPTTVPEPATLGLFLTGIGTLGGWLRLRKQNR